MKRTLHSSIKITQKVNKKRKKKNEKDSSIQQQ